MRWLAFGTYDARRHPRVGVLIEGLRASGDEVVQVNAPLDLDTAARVRLLREPWRIPLTAVALASCWGRLIRAARRAPTPDAVLVGYLGHFDVRLARLLFPGTPIALDHLVSLAGTAGDRGLAGRGGVTHGILTAIDRGALRRADVVIVDTLEHAATLPGGSAGNVVVVPVGAEQDWFAARRAAMPEPGGTAGAAGPAGTTLRVIFFGLFTALQGTITVGRALAQLAADEAVSITMVGTGQDYRECRRIAAVNPRVTWLDWVARNELPALVAAHHVCLGVFGTTLKARNVVPTKVFQGASAGCAIVTSDTEPQRRILDGAALFVPAGDPAALAGALRGLAAEHHRLAELRAAAARRADSAFSAPEVVGPLRDRVTAITASAPAARSPRQDGTMTTARAITGAPTTNAPLAPRAALRWDRVRRKVAEVAPGSILEIGCGMGAMGMRLARTAAYTAVELDQTSFTVAHERITPLGGTVWHGDLAVLPPGARYDLVCAFEVLEHLADDGAALAQWLPLVKPGGHLLLSVPADPGRFGPWDTMVGHYRRYTADELTQRLVEAGATDLDVTHYAWPLGYLLDTVRDRLADRSSTAAGHSPEQRTSGSGRVLQPSRAWAGRAIQLAVVPWAMLQRTRPGRGTGLVALASRPADPAAQA